MICFLCGVALVWVEAHRYWECPRCKRRQIA